jgi:hypothetical protein
MPGRDTDQQHNSRPQREKGSQKRMITQKGRSSLAIKNEDRSVRLRVKLKMPRAESLIPPWLETIARPIVNRTRNS